LRLRGGNDFSYAMLQKGKDFAGGGKNMKPWHLKVVCLSFLIIFLFIGCSKAPPVLKQMGPIKTKAGVAFNVQPNGESAMWFKTENATQTTVAVWGETRLNTTFVNPKELTALVVPKELYSKPGQFQIYLLDTKTGAKSNSLILTIEE
jgi:hypothetical protein